jgi:hypothetical protein
MFHAANANGKRPKILRSDNAPQTDKAHDQFQPQAQRLQFSPLVGGRKQFDHLTAARSVHPKQGLRRRKRTGRAAANHVNASLHVLGQEAITGEPSIIDRDIAGLRMDQLLDGQGHFAHTAGRQFPIQSDSIEQIIEHRDASFWIGCSRRTSVVFDDHPTELLSQFRTIRQADQRTVLAQQPMTSPTPPPLAVLGRHRQHDLLVQFDEGGVLEFSARMRERSGGHGLKEGLARQLTQKFMQVTLNRFDRFLQHEEHDDRKGQLSLTREVLGAQAMPRDEISIAQSPAQCFNQRDESRGNDGQNRSHPHCEYTLYLQCTDKSEGPCIRIP